MASWELAVGAALKQHRRAARMTQEELAERANYSASYISQIERGEKAPTAATIDLLALALELDAEQTTTLHQRVRQGHAPPRRQQSFTLPPLPTPLTSLIGRGALLDDLRREATLPTRRLLTLVGPAGVGKTRLALELGRQLQGAGELAVVFVPLDAVNDPELVVPTIARLLGVQMRNEEPLPSVIAALAESGPLLMTLDNFEQVTAAGPAIAELLRACPSVRVLATSRVPLALQGEHTVIIPPLETPPEMGVDPTDMALRVSSLELLIERISAVNHAFAPTPADILTLGAIARRLDGLPLALELVAARSALLSPQELLARLTSERIFHTLTSGARDLPDRQRTLYSALRWSYDLLDASAQRIFRGLAVLTGGTMQAAHTITLPGVSEQRFLDAVEMLVANNLVSLERDAGSGAPQAGATGADTMEAREGERRIGLLQTMRDFGWRCLREQREDRAVRQRHAEYYVQWGARMAIALQSGRNDVVDAIEREIENMRAALRWLQETDRVGAGLQLAAALGYFWHVRGYWREGLTWLQTFLSADATNRTQRPPEPSPEHSRAFHYASLLACNLGRLDDAYALATEALACAGGDVTLKADAYHALSSVAYARGDFELTKWYDEQQLGLHRQVGDQRGIARSLNNLAIDLGQLGRNVEAVTLLEESLAWARSIGDADRESTTLSNLCGSLCVIGEYDRARVVGQEALAMIRRIGAPSHEAHCLTNLGDNEFRAQALDAAEDYFQQSLPLYQQLGESYGVGLTYFDLGCVAIVRGDEQTALSYLDQARLYYDPPNNQRLDALVLTGLAEAHRGARRDLAMRYLVNGVTVARHIGVQDVLIEGMETWAFLLATEANSASQEHAAQLLGAIQSERERFPCPHNAWTRRKVDRIADALIASLGQERFDAHFAEGLLHPFDTLVAHYLETP